MGRKRKTPRETDPLRIMPLHYTKRDFEERNRTIVDFTRSIRSRNRDVNHIELSKEDVAEQFTLEVLQQYATTEARTFELLGQVESPWYNAYWAKVADTEAISQSSQPKDKDNYRILIRRKLPPALAKKYPHCVTLENKVLGLVIVPDIALCSIHQICFKKTVKSVFEANVEIDSLYLHVRQIWTAIVRFVYHYESSAAQSGKLQEMDTSDGEVDDLVEGYRLSHQSPHSHGALGTTGTSRAPNKYATGDKRKVDGEPGQERNQEYKKRGKEEEAHTEEEKDKEDIDAGQRDLSRKRLKRDKAKAGRWEELETELDSAGAAMRAYSVPIQFANTDLPLRLKS